MIVQNEGGSGHTPPQSPFSTLRPKIHPSASAASHALSLSGGGSFFFVVVEVITSIWILDQVPNLRRGCDKLDEFRSVEMDPPLINESSFSATNSSAHSLAEIWPLGTDPDSRGLGLRIGNLGQTPLAFRESSANLDGSAEESTLTEQSVGGGGNSTKRKEVSSEDESSKMVSRGNANDLVSPSLLLVRFDFLCSVLCLVVGKMRKVKERRAEKNDKIFSPMFYILVFCLDR